MTPTALAEKLRERAALFESSPAGMALALVNLPQALREAADLLDQQGWRDISSAPKDGTSVLLYWPYWADYPIRGWWSYRDRWDAQESLDTGSILDQPTHWMPLPPAPASTDKARP